MYGKPVNTACRPLPHRQSLTQAIDLNTRQSAKTSNLRTMQLLRPAKQLPLGAGPDLYPTPTQVIELRFRTFGGLCWVSEVGQVQSSVDRRLDCDGASGSDLMQPLTTM